MKNCINLIVLLFLFNMPGNILAETVTLDNDTLYEIKQQLFPLPVKLNIATMANQVMRSDCFVVNAMADNELASKYIAEFVKRNNFRFAGKSRTENVELVIGSVDSPLMKEAVTANLIDAKNLKTCMNQDQAYALSIKPDSNGNLKIYVAANAPPGIYYGLATLEQLLKNKSTSTEIVVPHVVIADYPAIARRGILNEPGDFQYYSVPKCNYLGGSFAKTRTQEGVEARVRMMPTPFDSLWAAGIKEGKFKGSDSVQFLINNCATYNIQYVPYLVHLNVLFARWHLLENDPVLEEIKGKGKDKPYEGSKAAPWCWENPKSQIVLNEIFQGIAKSVPCDHEFQVCISELEEACYCDKCKGGLEHQVISEAKAIVKAFAEAKKINPSLRMSFITSNMTYKYNSQFAAEFPPEIEIDYYHSQNTYKVTENEPILSSAEDAMARQGHPMGVVFLLGASDEESILLYPFYTPRLVKERIADQIKHNFRASALAWLHPGLPVMDFNFQALGEFAWNPNGRSIMEFTEAWAVRKGFKHPKEVADAIGLMEYSARCVSAGMRASRMDRPVSRMVDVMNGKKPYWGVYFDTISPFEQNGHRGVKAALKACDAAIVVAEKSEEKEFISGAKLLRQWVLLIDLYADFTKTESQSAQTKIREQFHTASVQLPGLWKEWIETQPISVKKRTMIEKQMEKLMAIFNEIGK